jgi:outer membrane protein TolC
VRGTFSTLRRLFCATLRFAVVFFSVSSFAQSPKQLTLSLDEAILLAVRTNPNVQSTKLSLVAQKFNTYVQEWAFYPHYSFQASATQNRTGTPNNPIVNSHNWNVQPGTSILTPIGTQVTLTSNNPKTGHYNPSLSLQIMQPLMRGFGTAVVESALNNARDTETISRLNIEGTLRTTVSAIINAYLDVVSAEKTIQIDEGALHRAEKSVEQTKLYIKAGHKAGNELVTVEANVASAKSQLENDRNNLLQARYALLAAIGIDPNTPVAFTNLNIERLISMYHMPTLEGAKHLILKNDIQYQVDQITLNGPTCRALLVAEDNSRWQLNLSASANTGGGSGGGPNAGLNSLSNGANQSQSVGLTLQIPIDDQLLKQAVVNAKIAMKQAQLALMQEKWNKETSAINGWNNVLSAERALHFANDAEHLQEKTYNLSYQKYLHGLIDSLELQTALVSLIQAQQTLLSARIGYLKALVNMDLLIGNTLNTWDIKVRL